MDQPERVGKGAVGSCSRNPAIVRPPLVPSIPLLLPVGPNTGLSGMTPDMTKEKHR
jgi:hypothetical protein